MAPTLKGNYTMSNLSEMTIKDLVALHNQQAGAEQLSGWKGKKDLLIEKVKEAIKKARGTVTIKSVSVDLLMATDFIDNDGRAVGFSYDHILEKVLEQFPDANTTVKCLRWYATHLNKDTNVKMPIRPRKKIEKPAAPAEAEAEADPTA